MDSIFAKNCFGVTFQIVLVSGFEIRFYRAASYFAASKNLPILLFR